MLPVHGRRWREFSGFRLELSQVSPLGSSEDSVSLKTGFSLCPADARSIKLRELTWSLVLLEGVIDEREVSHNGGIMFLGILHQVTLLETFVILLDGVAGEGDVLRGAVLTGLFQGL